MRSELPNKRSALVPTKREVALMLFSVAGGVWLWAVFIDWLRRRQDELAADAKRHQPQAHPATIAFGGGR